jgi:hypothetical protein
MNHQPIMGALFAAATLLASGAYAGDPITSPQGKGNATEKAEKKAEKANEKAEKAVEKAEKANDKEKTVEERAARKLKEHAVLRDKLKATLRGPMDVPTKQELRRHAERLARLERIKQLAEADKDTATVDKATALIAKENARHDTWLSKHGGSATAPTPATATATATDKAGAQ